MGSELTSHEECHIAVVIYNNGLEDKTRPNLQENFSKLTVRE